MIKCWKNDGNKLAQCRVATDFNLKQNNTKNTVSVKLNKMRYACNCISLWTKQYKAKTPGVTGS